jgi:serine/threonine protein kinase
MGDENFIKLEDTEKHKKLRKEINRYDLKECIYELIAKAKQHRDDPIIFKLITDAIIINIISVNGYKGVFIDNDTFEFLKHLRDKHICHSDINCSCIPYNYLLGDNYTGFYIPDVKYPDMKFLKGQSC